MSIPPPRAPIDREEALRLHREDGLSAAEIAHRLGFTPPAVRAALKESGARLQPPRRALEVQWGERLYQLWRTWHQRCSSPSSRLYTRYGASGYSICGEWQNFWPFYDWAIASGYRPLLNLEIVGRSKRFSPRTCRWITAQERMQRDCTPGGRPPTRLVTAFGETKPASDWARDPRCFVTARGLHSRLRRGVAPEQAITMPLRAVRPKDRRRAQSSKRPRRLLDWAHIIELHTKRGVSPAEIARQLDASYWGIRAGLKSRGALRKPDPVTPYAHGLRMVWERIRRRCENPSDDSYRYYGAIGARLCDEWSDFGAFRAWAAGSGYRPGLCLTRRRCSLLYSPRTCEWVTRAEIHSRTVHPSSRLPPRWTVEAFGELKGPVEWTRDQRCRIGLAGLTRRLRAGWSPEEAIATPPARPGTSGIIVRPLKAFGTTMSITDWSRDRRCKVTVAAVRERLERGMTPEAALVTPPFKRPS